MLLSQNIDLFAKKELFAGHVGGHVAQVVQEGGDVAVELADEPHRVLYLLNLVKSKFERIGLRLSLRHVERRAPNKLLPILELRRIVEWHVAYLVIQRIGGILS